MPRGCEIHYGKQCSVVSARRLSLLTKGPIPKRSTIRKPWWKTVGEGRGERGVLSHRVNLEASLERGDFSPSPTPPIVLSNRGGEEEEGRGRDSSNLLLTFLTS